MTRYTRYDEATRPLHPARPGRARARAAARQHARGARPMIFDAPLLAVPRPRARAGCSAPAAWLARRRRIRLARRWSPALGRLARARGAWAPLVLGLVGAARRGGLAGPRGGPDRGHDRDPRAQPGDRGGHQPVDARRGRGAQPAAARGARGAPAGAGPRGRPAGPDRVRRPELHPVAAHGGRRRHPRCTSTRSIPTSRREGGTSLAAVLRQGAELLGATADAADRVLVVFTDGEAHDSLPEIVAQAARAARGRRPARSWWPRGRAEPTRIPDPRLDRRLIEYKQDENGAVVRTAAARRRAPGHRRGRGGHAGAERGAGPGRRGARSRRRA